ncbi:Fas binding factor 1, partial [Chelydra serpentina]
MWGRDGGARTVKRLCLSVCKPPYLMVFVGESATGIEKKPLSTPTTPQRQYKKFSFEGLLSDEEEDAAKKLPPTGTKSSPERRTGPAKGMSLSSAPGHAVAPVRRREELTFEDDGDDLMDALGFGESPRGELKQERKG